MTATQNSESTSAARAGPQQPTFSWAVTQRNNSGVEIHEIDGFTSTLSTGFGQVATSARTMAAFTLGKLGVANGTGAFEQGIADAVAAFHSPDPLDPRLSPRSGIESVQLLERIIAGAAADLPAESATTSHASASISTTVGSTSAAADSAATPSAPILVIGGAGLIGQQVVKHLIDTGHRVRVMSRRPDRGGASGTHPSLEIIAGDFTDPTAVAAALSGVEVVCHLAFGGGSVWSDVLKNDVEPTLALVDAAAEAGVRRFVFSSTIAVYWAGRRAGSIDEQVMPDDGVLRVNPYARRQGVGRVTSGADRGTYGDADRDRPTRHRRRPRQRVPFTGVSAPGRIHRCVRCGAAAMTRCRLSAPTNVAEQLLNA